MTDTARRHPRLLSCLEIVRDKSEFSHRSAIRSVAIFTVTQCDDFGARFSVEHRAFDRTTTRTDILDGIVARIPSGATLIAKAPRIPQHYLRHRVAAGGPPNPADLQLIQRLREDLDILPLQCRSRALDETAAAYSIRRAEPGSSVLAQARKAPDEAMCLWLTFLWTLCRQSDRTSLDSAWEAWRALQRARPIPF